MATIDSFVANIQAAQEGEWDALVTAFRKAEKELKRAPVADVQHGLAALDPAAHPVGCACVLSLLCDGDKLKGDAVVREHASHWMRACSKPAMQRVVAEAACICRAFTGEAMRHPDTAAMALKSLWAAMLALQPTPEHMTPFHAACLQVALKTQQFYLAQALLRQPLYFLADTGLSATDYLLYGYYGALCHIGAKQWAKACELLELVIVTPTAVPDAIILAAWRRYQIVHALHQGCLATVPRHASFPTKREIKDSDHVARLCRSFVNGNQQAFAAEFQADREALAAAGLLGLASQLRDKLVTQSIKKLTATFLTLPLADIAREVGLGGAEEAARHVLKMIDAGDIHAAIDEEAGMVRFRQGDSGVMPELLATLHERIETIIGLQARLEREAKAVQLERSYIVSTMHGEQKERGSMAAFAPQASPSQAQSFDELMAD